MTRDIMGDGVPPRTKTSPARDGAWLRGSVAGVTHEKTGVCGACFKLRPSETTTYAGDWREEGARWSVSRVLSPPSRTMDDHSSGTRLATRLTRPTRAARRKNLCADAERTNPPRSPAAPIRSCSRWGLPCRPRCRGRGALLPHPFTLTRQGCGTTGVPIRPSGLFSVALSLGFDPRRPLAGTAFPWSPDFPRFGLRPNRGRPTIWRGGVWGFRRIEASGSGDAIRDGFHRPASSAPASGGQFPDAMPQSAATASMRARVPESASPETVSCRQWRWKAERTISGRPGSTG